MSGVLAQSTSQHVAGEIGYVVAAIVVLAILAACVGKMFSMVIEEWKLCLGMFVEVGIVATFCCGSASTSIRDSSTHRSRICCRHSNSLCLLGMKT